MLSKYLVLVLLIFITACKVSVIQTEKFDTKEALCKHIKELDRKKRNENIIYKYNAKVLFQNRNYDVEGNIITISDSVFYINAVSKSFGIEIARLKVTNTKVILVNKLQKEYFSAKIDSLNKIWPFFVNKDILSTVLLGDFRKQLSDYNCDSIIEQTNDQSKFFILTKSLISKDDSINCKWKENSYGQVCWLNIYNSKNKLFSLSNLYQNYDPKNSVPLNSEGKLLMQGFSFEYKMTIESIKKFKGDDLVINIPKTYKQINLNSFENH